jgi:hypothetical protein
MPNGTAGLIEGMSELESDAKENEVRSLKTLPWPDDMKDTVWMERIKLRQYCKRYYMPTIKQFWISHQKEYTDWFSQLTKLQLRKYFQLPRTEIIERLGSSNNNNNNPKPYNIHVAFATLLCAITEQVAYFPLTSYPADGRGSPELDFESMLVFHKRGGFTIVDDSIETRRRWLRRHETLGGPKLLERNEKSDQDKVEEEDDDDNDNDTNNNNINKNNHDSDVPSFRADRRMVRWLIAYHFAVTLQRAFLKEQQQQQQPSDDEQVK